jgi:hypothetical protein
MHFSIRRKFKIRLSYKSGNTIDVWAWKFKVKINSDGSKKCDWVMAAGNLPLYLNLSEVESIWQIDAKLSLCTTDPKVFV